nr:hypothetical protein 12 [Pelagibacteraceae bacterium]
MNDKAQSFADSKRNKMKAAQSAAGLVTRGPGMGTIANGTPVTTSTEGGLPKKVDGNDYTDSYKLGIADKLAPVNRDGSPRAASYTLLKESVNAKRMIGNAFNGAN